MQSWMRRVALCLAVPLVVGGPALLSAAPAAAATATHITVTSPSNPSKYGEEVRVTAHVWGAEETDNISAGSVQFAVNGFDSGAPVRLDGNGNAVSAPLVDEGGPMEVTMGSDWHDVTAKFIPDNPSAYDPSDNSSNPLQQRVDRAGSTMAILPSATSIVIDLSGLLPGGAQAGSARPHGTVHVTADGQDLGNVPVDANTGRATVNRALSPGQTHTVSATYEGDESDGNHYTGSSASIVRQDPKVEARVISLFPRSKSGWYRTPVEIWYRCTTRGAPLAGDCPTDVTLKNNGRNQSVTRTIVAIDGGTATVAVGDIDIDREKPHITVKGASCTATDELSGVKRHRCVMKFGENGHYRAIAYDRAGNRAVEKGVLD